MSRMLALIDAGWDSVRDTARRGARADVLGRIRGLLGRPDLPANIAADVHRLAAEILLERERYTLARRHLRAASRLQPEHAPTFYLWGLSQENDPFGSDRLAARQFRKASDLQPEEPKYRAAYGRAAIRCNRTTRGVRELLDAAKDAGGAIEVVRVVVSGLIEARRFDEARRVLNQARFLAPTTSVDRELIALQDRVGFETARTAQREKTDRHRQDAEFAMDGGRSVLPYIRIAEGGRNRAGSATRRDVFSMSRPHRLRMPMRRADG